MEIQCFPLLFIGKVIKDKHHSEPFALYFLPRIQDGDRNRVKAYSSRSFITTQRVFDLKKKVPAAKGRLL